MRKRYSCIWVGCNYTSRARTASNVVSSGFYKNLPSKTLNCSLLNSPEYIFIVEVEFIPLTASALSLFANCINEPLVPVPPISTADTDVILVL